MEVICLDTSVLIEHRRSARRNSFGSFLFKLSQRYTFAIPSIVIFELMRGENEDEGSYWQQLFSQMRVLDFDYPCCLEAARIYKTLRAKGQPIGVEDVLIAAVALANGLSLATGNQWHFSRIEGLSLLSE